MKTLLSILLFLFSVSMTHASPLAALIKDYKELKAERKANTEGKTLAETFKMGILNSPVNPNNVPDAKCVYNTSLAVPGTEMRITQFEIWTTRRGTLEKEGVISGFLKLRDNYTLKNAGELILPMTILEQGWITDRLSQPKSITETTFRKNVEIGGTEFNVVMKRTISNIQNPVVAAELVLYTIGEKPKAVLHARCKTEVKAKK